MHLFDCFNLHGNYFLDVGFPCFLKLNYLYFICVPHALRSFFTIFQGYLKVSVAVLGPNDQRVAYELEDGGNSSSSSSSSSARSAADSSVERNADGWEVIKNCEYPKAMKLKSWGIKANLFRAEHLPVSGMRWSHAMERQSYAHNQSFVLLPKNADII